MNIVCSTFIAKKFETVKEFKRDLGFTLTQDMNQGKGMMRTVFKIRDPFVRHYHGMYGFFANKHGCIGSIGIYIDPTIPNKEFKLFDEDREFTIPFDPGIENVRQYLSKMIGEIESGELQSVNVEVSTDGSIEFYVDPNLPPDEYQQEFLKQKRRMEELGLIK
jgi:hypothetical protein